ncbi:hypothetical protein NLM33_07345 [Bradyrhizobium sp. CCGUVB1N3]|uniref:hypothetical protein n=1 Tax=Bradyrhizobium sp. CCGUVB1N3 TaxID=2949629 RepID=UPI0020B3ADFB|nr:hypothetical protein [Bradyrhizobium sp. CCGUVB1N3]MCP3470141.1 hypothetical protein [Bradyrhizobium sp. CCGUVB1N3]
MTSGPITTVEVCDPHEITPTMWELFTPTPTSAITPPQFLARAYRAGDWGRYKREKHAYRTTVSVGKLGRTCFVRMADREPTDMVIGAPGLDHYCLTFLQQGSGLLAQPHGASPADVGPSGGAIFRGEPGTVLKTGRQAAKINVWIPAGLLRREAAAMLDGTDLDALDCNVRIDTSTAAGAGLQRMTEWGCGARSVMPTRRSRTPSPPQRHRICFCARSCWRSRRARPPCCATPPGPLLPPQCGAPRSSCAARQTSR